MITFSDITAKNFLSIGNATQGIALDRKDLTLIIGENQDLGANGARNGVGKTSLLNAVSYALYGQALTNIRRDNLINLTNAKGMLVSLEFSVNSVNYRIERGRRPNILRFFINNREQESSDNAQGDSRQTQEAIDALLGMSHDMFKHIVALNTYTEPFLAMRANDQRQIIEQLLGITLLSEKAAKIKEKIRDIRDLQKSEELRLKAIQEANRRVQEQIESLKMRQSMWATKQTEDIEAMAKAIVSLSSIDIDAEVITHKELADYLVADAEVTSLKESLKRLSKETTREASTIAKLESEIAQLTDHKCYACGQSFHDDKQQEVLSNKQNQLETHKTHLRTLEKDSAIAHEKVAAIGVLKKPSKTFYTSLEEALNHRSTLEVLKRDLENRRTETNPYSEQIVEMESRAIQEISYDKINEYTRILDHQEFLQKLLTNKDSFIRKKIIEQNLSYLNARLTYYLDKIGLPHSVVFQNDLSVLIEELGRELDFDNLSRGERNRLIVGLSLAFRDVWESLYLPINLFFVDELLDSGMDQIGTENSLAILKKMTRERKKSVWLISHKEELISRAENVLRVVKENGFTTFCESE